MDIKQLEAFISIAETGSFSKTAEKLFITQPTVSSYISALESELGSKLFLRSANGAVLTDDGKMLYEKASEMIKIKNDIYTYFGKSSAAKNTIVAGASTLPAHYMMPEILAKYRQLYPKTEFIVATGTSEELIKKISDKSIDAAVIGSLPENTDDFKCVNIFRDDLVIIMPNTEHYRELMNAPIEKVLEEPIILRESSGRRIDKYLSSIGVDLSTLNVAAKMNGQELIKRSVAGGMGISIMTKSISDDFAAEGKILQYKLTKGDHIRSIYLVYLKNRIFGENTMKFIEFVKNYYNDEPNQK